MDILWGTRVVDVSGWNYMSASGYEAYRCATLTHTLNPNPNLKNLKTLKP